MKNVKYIILKVVFSVMLLSCSEKQNEKTVSLEEEINEIVAYCITFHEPGEPEIEGNLLNNISTNIYNDNPRNKEIIEKAFSEDDIKYVRKQLNDTSEFRINKIPKNKSVKIIEADSIYTLLDKSRNENFSFWDSYYKKHTGSIITIGKPVFSVNKKTAVISIDISHGSLSSYRSLYLLEKKENRWKIIKTLSTGIS